MIYTHPNYKSGIFSDELDKYRLCWKGGQDFLDKYLYSLSEYETAPEFEKRKKMTPIPAFSKEAVKDVKNSMSQRAIDITRQTNLVSFQNAVDGQNGGVDNSGSNMNQFIYETVLPELLITGKVGVFVDNNADIGETQADNRTHPYAYIYTCEQILNWTHCQNVLTSVLLSNAEFTLNKFGQPNGTKTTYKLLRLQNGTVSVDIFDDLKKPPVNSIILNLDRIPFVIAEISDSLFVDIANYQIALLNLNSSDINYAWQSNFPIFTEQHNIATQTMEALKASQDGSSAKNGAPIRKVGIKQGIKYSKGAERPGFIHPSSEPLKISMEKEDQMKKEIRQLLNLTLGNLSSKMASAESKEADNEGKTSGLASIGMELERVENAIASFWANYENVENKTIIRYPKRYSLKSDAERAKEAKDDLNIMEQVNSITFQKEMAKNITTNLIGSRIRPETLDKIHYELEKAEVLVINPKTLNLDVESGILSHAMSAKIKNYPEGDVEVAHQEHVRKLTEIAEAQTKNNEKEEENDYDGRGVKHLEIDSDKSKKEKIGKKKRKDQKYETNKE